MTTRGYPQLELDRQLCFALHSASRAVVRAYGPLLADLGLTYPQYLAMLVLWESPGEVSVSELGRRLHLDSGTLTPLLKRLEQSGLVARRRDPGDERRVLVSPTADGRDLRDRAAGVPAAIMARYGVEPGDLGDLRERLAALTARLEGRA